MVKTSPKSPRPRRSPQIRGSWQKRPGRRDGTNAIPLSSLLSPLSALSSLLSALCSLLSPLSSLLSALCSLLFNYGRRACRRQLSEQAGKQAGKAASWKENKQFIEIAPECSNYRDTNNRSVASEEQQEQQQPAQVTGISGLMLLGESRDIPNEIQTGPVSG